MSIDNEVEIMKCLLVKAPFARWIVQGIKTIEYRRQPTHICDRIGIMQTGRIEGHTGRAILGDVLITKCLFDPSIGLYAWFLADPREYENPVYYVTLPGPQVWCNVYYKIPKKLAKPPRRKDFLQEIDRCAEAEDWAIRELLAKGPVKSPRRRAND